MTATSRREVTQVTQVTQVTRVGAYAICQDDADRVLLVRLSAITPRPGMWTLPGGGLDFGEDPRDAVLRELTEETGLRGTIRRLLTVASSVYDVPAVDPADDAPAGRHHAIRVVYDVEITGGELTTEASGSTDAVRWFHTRDLTTVALTLYARALIGSHTDALANHTSESAGRRGAR